MAKSGMPQRGALARLSMRAPRTRQLVYKRIMNSRAHIAAGNMHARCRCITHAHANVTHAAQQRISRCAIMYRARARAKSGDMA